MKYKSLFVSDIHLGTKQCQVQYLLKFIHDNEFENVFLIGDIIDIYSLQHKWYWHKDHNTFIQKILKMSRKNIQVKFLAGNHDEYFREFINDNQTFSFGDIEVLNEYVYNSVKGKRVLLVHGDEFDGAIRSMGWLYWMGDRAYSILLYTNNIYNWWRKVFGMKYWSLSAYLKSQVKYAIQFANNFDELISRKCILYSCDVAIYGHSHTPGFKLIKDKNILNIGDHQESCTCIVETLDGDFQLIRTTDNKILDTIKES
jgi:UDP-2,3-diacylglucosamine pyrophosphatase LpxH